ncbi:MAG: agmatinase family protein [Arenicellales bacterium]|nr:agmatinase family protein [Arenicellales bacterium]
MKKVSLGIFLMAVLGWFSSPVHAVGVDDTPESDRERAHAPADVEPIIPLNKADETYDLWKLIRDDLSEGREPGPINVQRTWGGTGWQGIPTFFRLPVALVPEDLKAGQVDVAIMGAHTDMGLGSRGANRGPAAFREARHEYATWGEYSMAHMPTLVNPFQELTMVDYGDAPVDPLSTERSMDEIRKYVRDIASVELENGERTIPIIIGGDHSLAYPNIAGVVDVYGKGNVGVIHFDAHYDATQMMGHLITHGAWVKRLFLEGLVPGKNFIQVALRGYYPDKDSFEWMREQGFRYHPMAEVERRGWDAVMKDVIKEAKDGPEYLYISFDLDTLDPAFAPGTGTPEPGGLTPREAFPIVRRLCAETNVIGFDLVEFAPERDPTYVTGLNANRIVRECLTGIAMRKKGITEEDYLSPLTVDDGRE